MFSDSKGYSEGHMSHIRLTYAKIRGVAHIYEFKTRMHNTKEGNLLVHEHHNVISGSCLN